MPSFRAQASGQVFGLMTPRRHLQTQVESQIFHQNHRPVQNRETVRVFLIHRFRTGAPSGCGSRYDPRSATFATRPPTLGKSLAGMGSLQMSGDAHQLLYLPCAPFILARRSVFARRARAVRAAESRAGISAGRLAGGGRFLSRPQCRSGLRAFWMPATTPCSCSMFPRIRSTWQWPCRFPRARWLTGRWRLS